MLDTSLSFSFHRCAPFLLFPLILDAEPLAFPPPLTMTGPDGSPAPLLVRPPPPLSSLWMARMSSRHRPGEMDGAIEASIKGRGEYLVVGFSERASQAGGCRRPAARLPADDREPTGQRPTARATGCPAAGHHRRGPGHGHGECPRCCRRAGHSHASLGRHCRCDGPSWEHRQQSAETDTDASIAAVGDAVPTR